MTIGSALGPEATDVRRLHRRRADSACALTTRPTPRTTPDLRQGELFGLATQDIDFAEMVIYVRRQVKKLGRDFVFALPKNDTERTSADV